MAETAGSAGLYRCGISRKPSFSLSSVCHDGEQHRILGAARHCGAALLSGAGIQLQEIAQHRGLGCGDGYDYRDRDDVYGVCHRASAEFLPHEQSVSRRNAVDVVDHYHHKGVHRPGTPAEEICLAGIRGAHSRGPVCGAHDGGALVDSHKQQCGGERAADERGQAGVFPYNMVSGGGIRASVGAQPHTPLSQQRDSAHNRLGSLFRHGCVLGVLRIFACARSVCYGVDNRRDELRRVNRGCGESGQGPVWRGILHIGRHDGRP